MHLRHISPKTWQQAFSYNQYRQLLDELMADGKTTGIAQEDKLIAYARLNLARMNRLDKIFKPAQDQAAALRGVIKPWHFLTLTEGWCGDAAQIVPVIDKMLQVNPHFTHRLLLRDEHLPIMDQFLTNGRSRSIPVTIMLDPETMDAHDFWGPRPSGARLLMQELNGSKANAEEIKEKLHGWYAQDRGSSTANEFTQFVLRTADC